METARTMGFKVHGDFITDLARDWFWLENKPYEVVENLLLECLCGTDLSKDKLKEIAQQIIEGRKKLVGVNEFTLEDDNTNIRPLSLKINEQTKKFRIEQIKNQMTVRMIDFVDPYSTSVSIKAGKDFGYTTLEHCRTWFWYKYDYVDHVYMRPKYPDDPDTMIVPELDDTFLGLWLYDYPEVVYEAMEKSHCTPYDHTSPAPFWDAIYEIITDEENKFKFDGKAFKLRNERYLASLRLESMKAEKEKQCSKTEEKPEEHDEWVLRNKELVDRANETIKLTEDWLKDKHVPVYNGDDPEDEDDVYVTKHHAMSLINHALKHEIEDHYLSRSSRMYFLTPDDYDMWEGLISPSGDFYSCDFGGHNAKAYHLMTAFPEKFPNFDYEHHMRSLDCSNALDDILEQGWCATRYLPSIGAYIELPRTDRGECTKAQKNAIFDAKIKHDVVVDLSPIGY